MSAVFFDIDGTLWDRENRIPDSTREAVAKLHENGHLVFLCSGRTRVMISSEDLLSLGFDGIIAGCGTQIEYQGRSVFCHEMDSSLLGRTLHVLKECRMPVMLEGQKYLYMDKEVCADTYGKYIVKTLGKYVRPLEGPVEQMHASKLTAMLSQSDYKTAESVLKQDFHVLYHGSIVAEMVPLGFSKAGGIKRVCTKLGIPHSSTVAFGDSVNDKDMLSYAALGVAMGNGTQEAKKAADYITDDIHQDGIYHALRHFHLI